MKARIPRIHLKTEKELKAEEKQKAERASEVMALAQDMLTAHFYQVQYRCYAQVFRALHSSEGFGETRFRRVWEAMNVPEMDISEWRQDGVEDYMLAKEMRAYGLDEIADALDVLSEMDAEENRKQGLPF